MTFKLPDPNRMVCRWLLCLMASAAARAGDTIQQAGDVLQLALPAAAVGTTIGHVDSPGTLQFGESAALTLGVTYVLKNAVDETRPNGGSESFPSGHTSISFCPAEFMRKRYGWEYGIPAYAAGTFVAYRRVEANEHYPDDVIAGAAIGVASRFIFTRPYKGWTVKAEARGRFPGLALNQTW